MATHPVLPVPVHGIHKAAHVIEYQEKKTGWLGRHIDWLKKDDRCIGQIFKKVLIVIEAFFAAVSGVGIYFLVCGLKIAKEKALVLRFQKAVELIQPPSQNLTIEMENARASFNHVQEYVICNQVIWERKRHSKDPWRPIYFDGFAKKRTPVALNCDGANLIVVDNRRDVHYKKVLHEYQRSDLLNLKNKRADYGRKLLRMAAFNLKQHPQVDYIAVDKALKNNWKKHWFNLPIISKLVNLFYRSILQIPEERRAWAVSHRGGYNKLCEDAAGIAHEDPIGVTTLYVLTKNGDKIQLYDPWSPLFAKINLCLPADPESYYRGLKLSVSASMMMLIGYENRRSPNHLGTSSRLRIKTRLCDIDTEGWNIIAKYTYFDQQGVPRKRRVVSEAKWLDHPLPLKKGEGVTKNITILQTGEGNLARELRVEGLGLDEGQLKAGYFYKALKERHWHFKAYSKQPSRKLKILKQEADYPQKPFQSPVSNYGIGEKSAMRFSKLENEEYPYKISLNRFGSGVYRSQITLHQGQKKHLLWLHKKKSVKNFFGSKGHAYDLIIPPALSKTPWIKRAIGKKTVRSIKIEQCANNLIMQSPYFRWTFQSII